MGWVTGSLPPFFTWKANLKGMGQASIQAAGSPDWRTEWMKTETAHPQILLAQFFPDGVSKRSFAYTSIFLKLNCHCPGLRPEIVPSLFKLKPQGGAKPQLRPV